MKILERTRNNERIKIMPDAEARPESELNIYQSAWRAGYKGGYQDGYHSALKQVASGEVTLQEDTEN
jgi:hypothetical protein